MPLARRLASLLVTLAACKAPPAGPELLGTKIQPPLGLDKLRIGMTADDAKTLVAGLTESTSELSLEVDAPNIEARLRLGPTDRLIRGITVGIAKDRALTVREADQLIEAAWGKGLTDHVWVSEDTGWRAELSCIGRCALSFTRLLTPAVLGANVGPPGALSRLHLGMTRREAEAVLPAYERASSQLPEDDTLFHLTYDSDALESIAVVTRPDVRDVIAKAWGPGVREPHVGEAYEATTWLDPSSGWRWRMSTSSDGDTSKIDQFVTAARLLGDGIEIAALPTRVLGARSGELAKAYTMYGAALIKLPPTEWETSWTGVELATSEGSDAISSATFEIPYAHHPAAKDELRTLFVAKWGEPKVDGELLVFHLAGPRIEVRDTRTAWQITLM